MKKLTIFFTVWVLYPMLSFGQVNTITLVASGGGTSKTEAESMALRSAIEQAFGTFVSANTTILNDDIVKDEIATISSGNIESYNIVAESETDGRWYVSVRAVVSINKLVEYAKSHGSSTEFAGQNFAMQMKMRKLNKENEEKALFDLAVQIGVVSSTTSLFDYRINQGNPQFVSDSEYKVPIRITANWNGNGDKIVDLINNTFCSLSLSSSEIESYNSNNYPMTKCEPLAEISGSSTQYTLRSDFAKIYIAKMRRYIHENLHSFSIVRIGGGEGYKSFFCPIKYDREEFGFKSVIQYVCEPTIPEKILYETEGFELVPDPTLRRYKPQMVDLGLSVKWSDMNAGGTPIRPYGKYYLWDINHPSCKDLKEFDDISHIKLDGKWRLPTEDDFKELKENCNWTWTTLNGIDGYKVSSKKTGYSNRWIFFPAAGHYSYNTFSNGKGYYWSSSISPLTGNPCYLTFDYYFFGIDVNRIPGCESISLRLVSE